MLDRLRQYKSLCMNRKEYVLCIFGIISASYTIQMMEFALIKTFSVRQNETMFILQLMTQGAIFILAIVLMICLFYKSLKKIKNNNIFLEI